ncbi:MAG: hypothetical protein BWY13_00069 [Euryarchaeota archaeon ADurb.Bin190]|nr:MAG: hypothetical protein BWY13_00069 [Euryarchaeota archaeon ADurb.Bin190]
MDCSSGSMPVISITAALPGRSSSATGVSVPENSPSSRSDSSWPTRFHLDLELLRTTCSIISSRV